MALHMARSDSSASRGRVAVQRCFCSSAGSSPEGLVTLRAGVERAAPLEVGTLPLLSSQSLEELQNKNKQGKKKKKKIKNFGNLNF